MITAEAETYDRRDACRRPGRRHGDARRIGRGRMSPLYEAQTPINTWQPYSPPTAAQLAERSQHQLNEMGARLEGLRAFAGPAFSAPLQDIYTPLRETFGEANDVLYRTEKRRDEVERLVDGMHAALKIPPRPAWDTRPTKTDPVKDVEDMVARCGAAEEALKNALAENAKLQARATVEWSNGQDARIAALEEGIRRLAREGHINRAQSGRIRREGYAALNKAAGIS